MSLVADHLNVGFLGVAAAAVSAQFLGWFWYSDKAFGKSYCKELERLKICPTSGEGCSTSCCTALGGTFVTNFVRAYCIAHMTKDYLKLSPGTLSSVGAGLHSAFVGFLGFILPTRLSGVFWAGQPWNIFGVCTGHEFVSTMVMGALIGYINKY